VTQANPDGSSVTTNPDGSSVTTNPDGSKQLIADGEKLTAKADCTKDEQSRKFTWRRA
jgi:hypothetical protein